MARDFPFLRDGDELAPWMINEIYAELRRWRRARGTNGITVTGQAGGGDPTFTGYSVDAGGLYRLTAALSAATSLATITHASAVPQQFSGTTLSDGGGTATLYNYHDKTFASSAIVWASPGTGGKLWVIDVRSCSNVS